MSAIKMKNKPTPCLAPLLSVAVAPNGRLRPCCWWYGYDKLESNHNIQKMDIQEYRNSVLKRYYKMMELSEYPMGCKKCDGPLIPRYDSYNNQYPQFKGKKWGEVTNFKHLDLRFGNLCNASCITCNYTNSNYFGKVAEQGYYLAPGQMPKTEEKRNEIDQTMTWHEDPKVIESIIESLEDVDYIYATGGEPTINPTLQKVMQHLIDENRADKITIEINTNGTNTNQKFLEMFEKFRKVVLFSMDAIGDLNNAMRFPTKFVQMEKNYWKYNDIMKPGDRLMITPTVTMHNWLSMADMFRWINENQAALATKLNVLYTPVWQCISRMPQELLEMGYKDMLKVEKVRSINYRYVDTSILVNDIKGRLGNVTVYKPPIEGDQYETWDESLEITRKWFASRGFDPASTKIPALC